VPAALPASQASEVCKEEVPWKTGIEGVGKRSEETVEASHRDPEITPEKSRPEATLLKRRFVDLGLHYYKESISSQDVCMPPIHIFTGLTRLRGPLTDFATYTTDLQTGKKGRIGLAAA